MHVVPPGRVWSGERAERTHMAENSERIRFGCTARKHDIIGLHLDEPGNSHPGVLKDLLRLPPLLMGR